MLGASKIRNTAVTISGVGGEIFSPYQVKIILKSHQMNESIDVRANVVDSISESLATEQFPAIWGLPEFESLDLADPYYKESRIEILLDVGYYFPCLRDGIIHSHKYPVSAKNTLFGWVLGGGF